jgi:hypothetical protein
MALAGGGEESRRPSCFPHNNNPVCTHSIEACALLAQRRGACVLESKVYRNSFIIADGTCFSLIPAQCGAIAAPGSSFSALF